jgi:2-dehydro-3-deoxyphosphogluconate aldolase/(4S)-4-hydroxy-2-oxoglutarate aldolase|tara:strand:- start:748 stop:1380 length:633 start_codon:yes stop_codon:yes gene_type:complete
MNLINTLKEHKVIPILTILDERTSACIEECLIQSHLPLIEVTLRDSAVSHALKGFHQLERICLGLGTIRSKKDIDIMIKAKAHFGVSPGFDVNLSNYAKANGLTLIPGVQTATEIMAASSAGHRVLKFFPATSSGGIEKLKSYADVFPDIVFIPTGGINLDLIPSYLDATNVIAVGSSSIISKKLVKEKKWEELTSDIISKMKGLNIYER